MLCVSEGLANKPSCTCLLYTSYDGQTYRIFSQKRIPTKNTHGTGCTLSSAIASYLARGETLENAVAKAKTYVTGAIEHALALGKGCGPTHHFYSFYPSDPA